MNVDDLKKTISVMGTGRLGTFGEYIIRRILMAKDHIVSGRHGDLKDFFVDNVRTDVKAHKRYMSNAESPKLRVSSSNRVEATDYVHLIFLLKDVAYYEENGKYKGRVDYKTVLNYWQEWPHEKKLGINDKSLNKARMRIRDEFKLSLEKALDCPVYVIERGIEITVGPRRFSHGPDNLSLSNIKRGENLMVYIQFAPRSTDFSRGTAFTVKDVEKRRFPMTHSFGTKERREKKRVVTEEWSYGPDGKKMIGMWGERHKYPMAVFAENTTLEQFQQKVVEKFHGMFG
jgi:hypothetical protein